MDLPLSPSMPTMVPPSMWRGSKLGAISLDPIAPDTSVLATSPAHEYNKICKAPVMELWYLLPQLLANT